MAGLVETFERHGVTFVSVTQQFNTTTSMGRLTLNILLSFAQFEREVKAAIVERLARLRLTIHETRAQVVPVEAGIPWLGFVVFPTHRLVKARKVRQATRRLHGRLDEYHAGRLSFAELEVSILGWTNHVAHADSWGMRRHMFDGLAIRPAEHRRALARRG